MNGPDSITGRKPDRLIVENRASGFVPGETVAKAAPDGYTIVLSGRSHWIAPLSVARAPYDPERFFKAGMEVVGGTPGQLDAMMEAGMAALGAMVKPAAGENE